MESAQVLGGDTWPLQGAAEKGPAPGQTGQQEGRWHLHSGVREGGCETPEMGLQQPESPTAVAIGLDYLSNHFQN